MFTMFDGIWECMQTLPEDQQKDFIFAIVRYGFTGEEEPRDPSKVYTYALDGWYHDVANSKKYRDRAQKAAAARWGKDQESSTMHKHNANDETSIIPNLYQSNLSQSKPSQSRFTPPTIEEVEGYIKEKGYTVDAQRFIDFYESKGWMVGKNKMKDWKAAVRTWQQREKPKPVSNSWLDQARQLEVV